MHVQGIYNVRAKASNCVSLSTVRDSLKVAYFNARSIRNKINELKAYLSIEQFDIVAISETWLDCDKRDYQGEFETGGYKLYNNTCYSLVVIL